MSRDNQVDHFIEFLLYKGKSAGTVKTYKYILETFSHWLKGNGGDLALLTRVDIQLYIKDLETGGKSSATIRKVFSCLSVFSRFVKKPDIVEDVRVPKAIPMQHIAPKSLSRNERNRLLRDVERKGRVREIAIIYTLLHTGVRVSELVSLNRGDIQIEQRSGSLTIRNGKGYIERHVPLSAEVRYHLGRYLNSRQDTDEALFHSNYQKRISTRAVQNMLSKYEVHPHMLRHTFCRELVGAGIDISTVADLAGHADINMTRRYSRPSAKELGEAIDKAFN
jgi:integrase/recombinase XerD